MSWAISSSVGESTYVYYEAQTPRYSRKQPSPLLTGAVLQREQGTELDSCGFKPKVHHLLAFLKNPLALSEPSFFLYKYPIIILNPKVCHGD